MKAPYLAIAPSIEPTMKDLDGFVPVEDHPYIGLYPVAGQVVPVYVSNILPENEWVYAYTDAYKITSKYSGEEFDGIQRAHS